MFEQLFYYFPLTMVVWKGSLLSLSGGGLKSGRETKVVSFDSSLLRRVWLGREKVPVDEKAEKQRLKL